MTIDTVRHRFRRWFSCAILLIGIIAYSWFGMPMEAWAEEVRLPTKIWEASSSNSGDTTPVLLPDWSQISLGSFPAIGSNGSLDGKSYIPQLGYDISRSWTSGMTPDQYLKLGDLSEALHPEDFSIDAIASVLGIDLNEAALSAFGLVGKQTIQHLVEIVPGLGELSVSDVEPILDLFKTEIPGLSTFGGSDGDVSGTLADVISGNEALGELKLEAIDLSQYSLSDIPNLDSVELGQYQEWANALVEEIPGLNQVPLSEFPNPIAEIGGIVMRIDMIYSDAENKSQRTISGSDQVGFSVPCEETKCAQIELDDLENSGTTTQSFLEGKQWISGKYQEVPGGFGVLGAVNGGVEPTGRHPFGSAFKVAVMEPDETTDTVDTAMFFRHCHRAPVDLGCAPYFIGPIPFFTYKVNAPIFVGKLDGMQGATSSTPTDAERSSQASNSGGNAGKYGGGQTQNQAATDPDCFEETGGTSQSINVRSLGEAIADIESSGNYEATGVYTCADGGRNCGRALGRYQFMSYHDEAASLIATRSGGQAFLDRMNKGEEPTSADLMQYFPPEDQDRVFRLSLSQLAERAVTQIDPQTQQPFVGDRLIERVAQMHFGGAYSKIDGGGSDALGRLSLKQYGEEAAKRYQSLGGSTSNVCAPKSPAKTAASTAATSTRNPGATNNSPNRSFSSPVEATRISQAFGAQSAPVKTASNRHQGVDLAVSEGTPVKAAAKGTVVFAGWAEGYGKLIILAHEGNYQTRYAHLSSIKAIVGKSVEAGTVIGTSGKTGTNEAPHLHFEVRENTASGKPFSGQAIDPQKYLNL
jgi:murein DD-endopeptidase MepM/ murein hydrolase activator NlpD